MDEFRKKFIDGYLKDVIDCLEDYRKNPEFFDELATIFLDARKRGNTVYFMGNGGSAATANHFVCDLGKGTIVEGYPRFKVLSLSDNIPMMLAWGNDACYEDIFVEQLKNLMNPGDVIVGISGSGNSGNVLRAIEWANENGGITVGLTGFAGGKLKDMAKHVLVVPIHYMQKIEDIHMLVDHLVTSLIREEEMSNLE